MSQSAHSGAFRNRERGLVTHKRGGGGLGLLALGSWAHPANREVHREDTPLEGCGMCWCAMLYLPCAEEKRLYAGNECGTPVNQATSQWRAACGACCGSFESHPT